MALVWVPTAPERQGSRDGMTDLGHRERTLIKRR